MRLEGNQFEAAARERKTTRIVEQIDAMLAALGVATHGAHGASVAFGLRQYERSDWLGIAKLAGVHAPSETTIAEVIRRYEQRAERAKGAAT
jgi:hypothetical protein